MFPPPQLPPPADAIYFPSPRKLMAHLMTLLPPMMTSRKGLIRLSRGVVFVGSCKPVSCSGIRSILSLPPPPIYSIGCKRGEGLNVASKVAILPTNPDIFLVCRRRRISIIHKDPKPTRTPLGLTNEVGLSLAESTASAKTVGWPRSLPYGQRPLRVPCPPVSYLCLHYFVVAEEKNRCLPNPVNCNAVFFLVSSACIQSLRNSHIYWPFFRIPTFRQISGNESVVRVAMKVIIFFGSLLGGSMPLASACSTSRGRRIAPPTVCRGGGGCFAVSPIF